MKTSLIALTGASLLAAGTAAAQEGTSLSGINLQGSIGIGVMLTPEYMGSGETKTLPLPLVDISSPDSPFFLSTRKGLGAKTHLTEKLEAGLALQYVPGRDEGDDSHLRGLGDIDATAGVAAFASYELAPRVKLEGEVRQELGGSEGWTSQVGVTTFHPLNKRTTLIAGLNTTYASEDHMRDWYGVDAVQSARSGLPRFDAEGGFRNINLVAGANYALTEKVSLNATGIYGVLLGDAKKSPVTEKDTVPSLLLGATYRF